MLLCRILLQIFGNGALMWVMVILFVVCIKYSWGALRPNVSKTHGALTQYQMMFGIKMFLWKSLYVCGAFFTIGGLQRTSWCVAVLSRLILNCVCQGVVAMNQHIIFYSIVLFSVLFGNMSRLGLTCILWIPIIFWITQFAYSSGDFKPCCSFLQLIWLCSVFV